METNWIFGSGDVIETAEAHHGAWASVSQWQGALLNAS
jgi:hypothetical protein